MSALPQGLLRPLPIRRIARRARPTLPFRPPLQIPAPALGDVLRRGVGWSAALLRFLGRLGLDLAAGRRGPRAVATRLRTAFEEMGGPAVKLGQQLSIRVDLLPFEFCEELSKLTDRVVAIPVAEAIAEIERAVDGPLSKVFAAFDPEPIGAASIACVYRARLHTGESVAVKVQRPQVAAQFAADIAAFSMFSQVAEALTLVRPGFFTFLRQELRSMFYEELDFKLEARYQALFRTYAERDRMDWLTSPRMWREWCTSRVLVSEFVEGVTCTEVVAAVETRDAEALARLRAMDIDPAEVGRRVFLLALWGRFETPFVHGDPHPANILILPGSRLCMLDFGACSVIARKAGMVNRYLVRHMINDEVSEMVGAVLQTLAPLPLFDRDAFRRDVEQQFYKYQFGLRDPSSPWFERTSASLWVYLMEVTQKYMLPINLDTLRMMRATLLYDTLAFRLNPKINLRETEGYLRDSLTRYARRRLRAHRKQRRGGLLGLGGARRDLSELRDRVQGVADRVSAVQGGALPAARRLVGTASVLAKALLRLLLALGALGLGLYWFRGTPSVEALLQPAPLLLGLLVILLSGYRLRHRLMDVDR